MATSHADRDAPSRARARRGGAAAPRADPGAEAPARHQRPVRRRQEPGEQAVRGPRLLRASTTCRRRCSTTSWRCAASEPDRYRRVGPRARHPRRRPRAGHRARPRRAGRPTASGLELIYLEASDATPRQPLQRDAPPASAPGARSGVQASIGEERRRLARARELADHVVDTTGLSIGQLKERLFALVPRQAAAEGLQHRHRDLRLQVRASRSRRTSSSTCAS